MFNYKNDFISCNMNVNIPYYYSNKLYVGCLQYMFNKINI